MFATGIVCRRCGARRPLGHSSNCEACGGILDIQYDYSGIGPANPVALPDRAFPGIWQYHALLPVADPRHFVSLGEGDTPLLPVPRVAEHWGCGVELMIKAEQMNPSGSFKDRPTAVGVSAALENGFDTIVISSSGNASASAAAYAARAGMECVVFIPEATDPNKVVQAQSYGARVFHVKGKFPNCYAMAAECAKRFGWANVTSTFQNPFTVEGDKTPSYDLYRQLDGRVPDCVLIPISAGPLLVGMHKGFEEMLAFGVIDRIPAMIGVQAKACEPITRAFENGDAEVRSWEGSTATAAGGISDPLIGYAADGTLTLDVIRRSGGLSVSLDEEEIAEAVTVVEKKTGLYSEPSGAISVGAVKKLWRQGRLREGAFAVSVVTGHGFKFSGRKIEKPKVVEDIEAFSREIGA